MNIKSAHVMYVEGVKLHTGKPIIIVDFRLENGKIYSFPITIEDLKKKGSSEDFISAMEEV